MSQWICRLRRCAVLLTCALSVAGCDSLLGTDQPAFAAEARVLLTGESPVPVLLVTSTVFTAARNENGQLISSLIEADTTVLTTIDHDETYDIYGADRFLVRVVNPDEDETASVHLRVLLDGREVYNQRATMRDASLEYIAFYGF